MRDEALINYERFLDDWRRTLIERANQLTSANTRFSESYLRLVSLQAWRETLLADELQHDAFLFFLEAQNDGMISHVQASIGSWRVALKTLRSLIENTLLTLYYKDHPVELERWKSGTFRIGVSECFAYFEKHPVLCDIPAGTSGLELLRTQYKKLSEAVHASSEDFRMTAEGTAVCLWQVDDAHESVWHSYERRVLQGVNLLLLAFFRDQLHGGAFAHLREAVSFAIPSEKDNQLHSVIGVRLRRQ